MDDQNERGFTSLPGYIGGVTMVQADWPAYPVYVGSEGALLALACFPRGTVFHSIDDISQCVLFRCGKAKNKKDPYDARLFHVAVWHEDLIALSNDGLIAGAVAATERQWAVDRRQKIEREVGGPLYYKRDEKMVPFDWPDLDDHDDEHLGYAIVTGGVTVSNDGWSSVERLQLKESQKVHTDFKDGIAPLVDIGRYDDAIRHACVALEERLRSLTGSRAYGQPLVEQLCNQFIEEGFIPSHVKMLRGHLRAALKFVRNNYAHSFQNPSREQAFAIVGHLSWTLRYLDEFCAERANGEP